MLKLIVAVLVSVGLLVVEFVPLLGTAVWGHYHFNPPLSAAQYLKEILVFCVLLLSVSPFAYVAVCDWLAGGHGLDPRLHPVAPFRLFGRVMAKRASRYALPWVLLSGVLVASYALDQSKLVGIWAVAAAIVIPVSLVLACKWVYLARRCRVL